MLAVDIALGRLPLRDVLTANAFSSPLAGKVGTDLY